MECRTDGFDPKQLSPLTLAFLGDSVFEIFIRERLVRAGSRPPSALQKLSAQKACCRYQAKAAAALLPQLSGEEAAVFRRGKNAHPGHFPKNADPSDYHSATALEALFGYLYLTGSSERLKELLNLATAGETGEEGDDCHDSPEQQKQNG